MKEPFGLVSERLNRSAGRRRKYLVGVLTVSGRGWRGVTRGCTVRTTVRDPTHSRAPDLVKRNFTAERPGQLHVADFTYVPLDGGGLGVHRVLH